MSVVVLSFSSLLTDFGISTTVVTRREVDSELVKQLNAISVVAGATIMLLVIALTPFAVMLFKEPRVGGVLTLLSCTFLLSGATNVPVAWMQRHLEYRKISLLELVRSLVTSLSTLILAYRGAEYWALSIGNLIGVSVFAALVLVVAPLKLQRPDFPRLRPILYHTHNFLFSSVAWFGYSNADSVVLGRLSGTEALGLYRFAVTLASMPGEKLVNVLSSVTLPVFGALQEDTSEIRRFFLDLTELVALVAFPLLSVMAAVSQSVLPLLFGSKWNDAIPILQIMCIVACLQNLQALNGQVLRARGRSREGRTIGILALIFMPIFFIVGAQMAGGVGVSLAWVIGQPILFGYPFYILKRDISLPLKEYVRRLIPGILMGVVAGFSVFSVGLAARIAEADLLIRVALQFAAATIVIAVGALLYRERGFRLYRALVSR